MENTPTLTITKEKAKEAYKQYATLVKTRKEQYIRDLKQVYWNLAKGNKILDIYEVFKKSGVDAKGEPNLALVKASEKIVIFKKGQLGQGQFRCGKHGKWNSCSSCVRLPVNTFPDFPKTNNPNRTWQEIKDEYIETKTPIIPAHLVPNGDLKNYYILWEVKEWSVVPSYGDPFLLKRINKNTFAVLAEWDLTPIEQAVIRGL